AGIILTDEEEIVDEEEEETVIVEKKGDRLQDFTIDKLNEMLDEALKAEDYERAAKIRDEINRRS
ncbi:MAG TPA: UvrB/UvrC motif-containing protein, partial [Roseivirga sp.]